MCVGQGGVARSPGRVRGIARGREADKTQSGTALSQIPVDARLCVARFARIVAAIVIYSLVEAQQRRRLCLERVNPTAAAQIARIPLVPVWRRCG